MKGERIMEGKKSVLFICTHNSARSQMAEGLLRSMYGDRYDSFSAGTVKSSVSPYAIRAMTEIGIDISDHRSKSVEEFREKSFDYVVTVCDRAKETCPFFPGKVHIHQSFEDPAGIGETDEERMEAFRRVRDEIKKWIVDNFGKSDLKSVVEPFKTKI